MRIRENVAPFGIEVELRNRLEELVLHQRSDGADVAAQTRHLENGVEAFPVLRTIRIADRAVAVAQRKLAGDNSV